MPWHGAGTCSHGCGRTCVRRLRSLSSVRGMVPPSWLDASGRRLPTLACWTCGRETAPMRLRADDLRRHGRTPLLDRVSPGARQRRVVVPRADLGAGRHRQPVAAVATGRAVLGNRDVILRLTLKTAAPVGETPNAGGARHE
jgi:hypothetical protein